MLRILNIEGCLLVIKELFEGIDFGILICLYIIGADWSTFSLYLYFCGFLLFIILVSFGLVFSIFLNIVFLLKRVRFFLKLKFCK